MVSTGRWVPPETPSGAAAAPPAAWNADRPAAEASPLHGGAAGVAVARGDARTPRPAERVGGGTGETGRSGSPDALAGNPLAHLGVTGPGGILDGGFELLRFRFWRLVALAAALFLPLQLADLWSSLSSGTAAPADGGSTDFTTLIGPRGLGSGGSGWSLLIALARPLALFLLGIGVGHLVAGWLDGRDRTFGQAMAVVARRAWVAPVAVAVSLGAKFGLGCFGGVGFFLVDALFFTAGIVAGAELLGPFATIGRSYGLSRAAYGVALVTAVGSFVISQVLQLALTAGPVLLVASFQPPEAWLIVVRQAASLVLLVVLALTACIAARAYVELRCRTEGYDLIRRQGDRGLL